MGNADDCVLFQEFKFDENEILNIVRWFSESNIYYMFQPSPNSKMSFIIK